MCLVPFLKFKKMGTIGICPPKNGAARFDSCRPCPSCHRITLAHLHANVAASPVSEICLLPRAIRCKKGCTCVEKEMSFAISTSSSVTYLTLQARVPMAIPMLTCHQMVARTHAHARADPCGSGRDAKIAVTGGPESLQPGVGCGQFDGELYEPTAGASSGPRILCDLGVGDPFATRPLAIRDLRTVF